MMEYNPTVLWVVALALADGEGRYLLQKRPPGRAHAGLWEFPGGKVEPAETPESALVREIKEELDITVQPETLRPVGFASGAGSGTRSLVILLYTTARWGGVLRAAEGQELGWYAPCAMADLPMLPLDYPLGRELLRFVENENR